MTVTVTRDSAQSRMPASGADAAGARWSAGGVGAGARQWRAAMAAATAGTRAARAAEFRLNLALKGPGRRAAAGPLPPATVTVPIHRARTQCTEAQAAGGNVTGNRDLSPTS